MREMTLEDLKRMLNECAGESDVSLEGDILDRPFEELGYDSLALIETAACISRDIGVVITDDQVPDLVTPRHVLDKVNSQLLSQK